MCIHSLADIIALPSVTSDVSSSLGIITLRTSFLPDIDAMRKDEYQAAIVKIAEAVVEQYFGGLISPRTWKSQWLWDGLRQYLSKLVLSLLEPTWSMDEMQLQRYTISALNIDAVQQRDNIINSSFTHDDSFHVDKTVAILSMLHATLGDENFRGCLKTFIGARRFLTAEPNDLYSACHRQINGTKDVRQLLDLWTKQPGYPLLTVIIRNGTTVDLFQRPFEMGEFTAISDDGIFPNGSMPTTTTTTTPSPLPKSTRSERWIFPVKYVTNLGDGVLWLEKDNGTEDDDRHA